MRHHLSKFHIIWTVMVILLLTAFSGRVVQAAGASGTCGESLTWTLEDGVLTISGQGAMTDYGEFSPAPWNDYKADIRTIRVDAGVTGIGDFAFFCLTNVKVVNMADTVTNIGGWSFYGCSSLETLQLSSGVKVLEDSAFEECQQLLAVTLPEGLEHIGYQAFYRCSSLKAITIPSTVTYMGVEVFTYCTSLQRAVVLASLQELPRWTFYGCEALAGVSLNTDITSVGNRAFDKCENLSDSAITNKPATELSGTTTEVRQDGTTVTTNNRYVDSQSGEIFVETSKVQGTGQGESSSSVKVEAFVKPQQSWEPVKDEVNNALRTDQDKVEVSIYLQNNNKVSGKDIECFAGKDVTLTVHTTNGTKWHVNGKDITRDTLKDSYDLSFSLSKIMAPDKNQADLLGEQTGYIVRFHAPLDFKTEVEIPLDAALARATAGFFVPDQETGYKKLQSVVVDAEGIAHFYLGNVQKEVDYLIGVNIPEPETDNTVSDAIVPSTMQNEYPTFEQTEQIEYIVTGVKSSWGLDFGQVTWILAGVMLSSVVVVGLVVYIFYKRSVKNGTYMPMQ